jgi:RIO kinase 1
VHTLGLRRTFDFVTSEPAAREGGGARKGGRAGLEKQEADFDEDKPNPNAAHDAQLKRHASAASESGAVVGNRVTGGGAWYTGLHGAPAPAPAQLAGESEAELMHALEELMHQLSLEPALPDPAHNTAADDEVFKATYIPFSLHEVDDPEHEIQVQKAPTQQKPKAPLENLLPTSSSQDSSEQDQDEDSDDDSEDDDSEDDDSSAEAVHPKDAKLSKEDARAAKKEAKKQTKAATREKRKTKMPKAEKKRRMKKNHK